MAVLLAAEVFLGGAILWALGGGRWGWTLQARAVNNMSEQAPIDAGRAPHVVIDDPDNRVVITASSDGKVHVTDHRHQFGWFAGPHSQAPLRVSRTDDGVSIMRGDGQPHLQVAFFGVDFERTDVAVPSGARLDVRRCEGASIDGVRAGDVKIACGDGSLHLDDLQSPSIDAVTQDGGIHASNLEVGGGRLETGSGSIRVALAGSNLLVHAQTGDGSIRINGRRIAKDSDSGRADYQVGTGGGSLQVSTQDGSIHIDSNGAN
ncbi:MAG TPA: DUF4097 family beta strand repeat-containing protein [Candidatus Baltobacteraceae bacterium]|nr:DUF4097 family beta strand repeat-containing protein [Candidatus Baltobacteraceae bacterium]